MFGTPLIAFSIGEATVCSSTSADAPGYTVLTVTTGGAISGYCAIGRLRIAESPASTRNTEITAAKIGRSMKKRENMVLFSLLDTATSARAAPVARVLQRARAAPVVRVLQRARSVRGNWRWGMQALPHSPPAGRRVPARW